MSTTPPDEGFATRLARAFSSRFGTRFPSHLLDRLDGLYLAYQLDDHRWRQWWNKTMTLIEENRFTDLQCLRDELGKRVRKAQAWTLKPLWPWYSEELEDYLVKEFVRLRHAQQAVETAWYYYEHVGEATRYPDEEAQHDPFAALMEAPETEPGGSSAFEERLGVVARVLGDDPDGALTSWAKLHAAIQQQPEPPPWAAMITPDALRKCLQDGLKRRHGWARWPDQYKGFKRTRSLLVAGLDENQENQEIQEKR